MGAELASEGAHLLVAAAHSAGQLLPPVELLARAEALRVRVPPRSAADSGARRATCCCAQDESRDRGEVGTHCDDDAGEWE